MNVLFVCLGNICRSPAAEAVFRHKIGKAGLAERITVDSAGTGDWHAGKAPDRRMCQAAARRGYDLSALRARQVEPVDFSRFDLILAMDQANLRDLEAQCPVDASAEVDLFLRRYRGERHEVSDPYYGGEEGFEDVLNLIEIASDALLAELRDRL